MFKPTKVLDIELGQRLVTIEHLEGYGDLQALVRLHGTPLGYISVPVTDGRCLASTLGTAILNRLNQAIVRHLVCDGLALPPQPGGLRIADLMHLPHALYSG